MVGIFCRNHLGRVGRMTHRSPTIGQQVETEKNKSSTRKRYTKPEIILEFDLETRAGSPLVPGLDLLNTDKWESSDK
jgi:hypothetical protein